MKTQKAGLIKSGRSTNCSHIDQEKSHCVLPTGILKFRKYITLKKLTKKLF